MSLAYWDAVFNNLKDVMEDKLAADASRISPIDVSLKEKALFPAYATDASSISRCYLYARNRVLAMFISNPLTYLRVEDVRKQLDFLPVSMVQDAYNFCLRQRLINFGLVNISPQLPINGQKRRPKIVIIGSGIAGLSTALELQTLFHNRPDISPDITILEGRQRSGGRIYTFPLLSKPMSTLGLDDGVREPACVELAAQIVTGFGRGNPLAVILRSQLGVELHYTRGRGPEDCPLYDYDGARVNDDKDKEIELLFNACLEKACQTILLDDGTPQLTNDDRDTIRSTQHGVEAPSLGAMIQYWLERDPKFRYMTHTDHRLFSWHVAHLEFANATTLESLSLHHWDQDDEYGFTGFHAMIKGGFSQLPVSYVERLKESIHYNKTVDKISWKDAGMVDVSCTDGTILECDAVVVTAPLGSLKSGMIEFEPPLSICASHKAAAITNLGFGLLNKVIMVFPRQFWRTDIDSFGYLNEAVSHSPEEYSRSRGISFHIWNWTNINGMPVLVAFISGKAALELEQVSDQVIVEKLMNILTAIHRDQAPIPKPIESVITRWSKDPYARGSYSSISPRATGQDYDHMAATIAGKIFWAGEHTNRQYPASVHGALLSGMRVATSIADIMMASIRPAWMGEPKRVLGNASSCPRPDCGVDLPPHISVFSHLQDHVKQEQQAHQQQRAPEAMKPRNEFVKSPIQIKLETLQRRSITKIDTSAPPTIKLTQPKPRQSDKVEAPRPTVKLSEPRPTSKHSSDKIDKLALRQISLATEPRSRQSTDPIPNIPTPPASYNHVKCENDVSKSNGVHESNQNNGSRKVSGRGDMPVTNGATANGRSSTTSPTSTVRKGPDSDADSVVVKVPKRARLVWNDEDHGGRRN
ncbi:hypothetical protein SmJEL517_g04593 [Synchytrium microbalum]|uniref:SWIRM domain-containing protein n=1 Tax=Synchytrium microbalum TaxID=1806994 RepID=A0A507BYT3_9FUNG|nr:uncharacterized protein SmJEL517_g04593 [Synchytrium microbalum]TPX32271.1 hypothetical protein SmJEL517_g04593 [Synchytrium microbalum]